MTTLLQLPTEIFLRIIDYLLIPPDYKGYYIAPQKELRTVGYATREGPRHYLNDTLKLSATCKRLRQFVGPLVWGDLVLNYSTFSDNEKGSAQQSKQERILALGAHLEPDSSTVKAGLLEFVTVFEPHLQRACILSTPTGSVSSDEYETIRLVNPVTMPSLQRLIVDLNHQSDDSLCSLGWQLAQYARGAQFGLRRVQVSATMTSSVNLSLLKNSILPFVDHLNFTITGLPDKLQDFSPLESLRGLQSLTLMASVTDAVKCRAQLQNLRNMIHNNRWNLESLDLQNFPMMLGEPADFISWCVPSLKRLACSDKHLGSFPQTPNACRNLQILNLRFNRETNLGELAVPLALTHLSTLQVVEIPAASKPDEYFSFFSRLQLVNPELENLEFSYLSLSQATVLAPVICKFKSLTTRIMHHAGGGHGDVFCWPMIAPTLNSLKLESPHMPINRLITQLFPSSIRQLCVPLSSHELISYPLLKSIALQQGCKDGTTNDTELVQDLFVSATWPRVSEKLTSVQIANRNECLGLNYMSPHVDFQVYESVCLKPTGDAEDLAYLSDLFLSFQEPFPVTEFCHLIRDLDTLAHPLDSSSTAPSVATQESETGINDDAATSVAPKSHRRKNSKVKLTTFLDVPEWQQVEMQVKIDLQRLRELLSEQAS